jgi:hypothetical protein
MVHQENGLDFAFKQSRYSWRDRFCFLAIVKIQLGLAFTLNLCNTSFRPWGTGIEASTAPFFRPRGTDIDKGSSPMILTLK